MGKLSAGLTTNDEDNGTAAKWAKVQADLALDPSLVVAKQYAVDLGGNTSVRNEYPPSWKDEGYYQRARDLGQVFTPVADFTLDYLILRTGNGDNAFKPGTAGAPLTMQFFEVSGTPVINNNGTRYNQNPTHGFGVGSNQGRCDDYITGVTYTSIKVITGATMPDLTVGGDGKLTYMKWDLTGGDEMVFQAGKRYAFMVGLENGALSQGFTLGNQNNAHLQWPENLTDSADRYNGGWGIRREGDGSLPYNTSNVMQFIPNPSNPTSDAHLTPEQKTLLLSQSTFPAGDARYAISPTTDGYPDVDTYRDLEFYMLAKPGSSLPPSLTVTRSTSAPSQYALALPDTTPGTTGGTTIRYFTSGTSNIDRGQTFTATSSFVLDKITVKVASLLAGAPSAPVAVEFWQNNGGTWSLMSILDGGVLPADLAAGDFLTLDIANQDLVAGRQYGFLLRCDEAAANREINLVRYGDAYADGSLFQRVNLAYPADRSGVPALDGTRDMVFYLTPVPEPAVMGLLAGGGLMLLRRRPR